MKVQPGDHMFLSFNYEDSIGTWNFFNHAMTVCGLWRHPTTYHIISTSLSCTSLTLLE